MPQIFFRVFINHSDFLIPSFPFSCILMCKFQVIHVTNF
nr:MAG TPA: hypothetical protein [Caudoviricetes sp.]